MHTANDRRVLLIGWDAADWRVIEPLIEQGKMPALKRLMDAGVSGNLATLRPAYSPMLWTSIATGKRPYKHGIHGFIEPTPDGRGVRPVTNLSRSVKAVWNILTQIGKTSNVIGWWPSHPAEPIDGVMVSNFFQRAVKPVDQPWPMADGTVHPPERAEDIGEFRFHPGELGMEHMLPFMPKLPEMDQSDRRVQMCAKTLAEATSIHGAATAVMQLEAWDFMAVYHDAIDHFCHGFMKFHPPKQDHISDEDFERYQHVVEAGYRYHDMMLGAMMQLAGDDTTVILMSDHGFHPDHLRPRVLPAEPAGPAAEHRHYGIFVAKGPGIPAGERVYGATVLDITPTILHLMGLPVGADMDGKALTTVLEDVRAPEVIPSWEDVEGPCGMHPPEARESTADSAEAMKQLIELGYVEDLGEDVEAAVRQCVREQRYNLAQAYVDGGKYAEASRLLDELWTDWPEEHRFGMLLVECFSAMGDLARRRQAVETFEQRAEKYGIEAREKLEQMRPEIDAYREGGDKASEEMPKKLQADLRRLGSLAQPKRSVTRWLHATQSLLEGDLDKALHLLEQLSAHGGEAPGFRVQLGSALAKAGRHADAMAEFERTLKGDPDHAGAHLGIATAALELGDVERAVEHALTSTELVYFQPRAHATLASALMRWGRVPEAEAAFGVALSQAPRLALAHEGLATLCREHLGDEARAEKHDRLAREAREDAELRAGQQRIATTEEPQTTLPDLRGGGDDATWTDPEDVITIVAGLPRSGTSMMMQMLAAGGIEPYTDNARAADEDNPRGYLEHANATALARDTTWLPEARGKVVKIVAQLLPCIPPSEKLRIVFMTRDLREIIASQRVMLDRLGKKGAALEEQRLMRTLAKQVQTVGAWLESNTNAKVLCVAYDDATVDPAATAARVAAFAGADLDVAAMASAVDAGLRRQRSS